MRFNWHVMVMAAVCSAVAVGSSGCSGINAQGSVSPATFLLPGLMQVQPESSGPTLPAAPAEAPRAVALAR